MTGEVQRWEIPAKVWAVLMSWGLAVLLLAGMISYQSWRNQREMDRSMCAMIAVFQVDEEAPPGPAGDRSRAVQAAMRTYSAERDCPPR